MNISMDAVVGTANPRIVLGENCGVLQLLWMSHLAAPKAHVGTVGAPSKRNATSGPVVLIKSCMHHWVGHKSWSMGLSFEAYTSNTTRGTVARPSHCTIATRN